MRIFRLSVGTKLLVLVIGIMLGCLGIAGAVANHVLGVRLTDSEAKALNMKMDHVAKILLAKGAPAIQGGHLVIGTTVVDGNGALVDELSSLLGDSGMGIFNGDVRVAASARKPDDTRAAGVKLDPVPREAIYSRGERYTGQINVGGISFFSVMLPIRDSIGRG